MAETSKTAAITSKTTTPRTISGHTASVLKHARIELRNLVANRPTIGRLTADEKIVRDRLALAIITLYSFGGLTMQAIADELKMPLLTVRDYIARGRVLTFDGDSREQLRQWILARQEELLEVAASEGNITEARLLLDAMGRFASLVSTGGNVLQVGGNVSVTNNQIDTDISAFIAEEREARQLPAAENVIDGEVIGEDEPS